MLFFNIACGSLHISAEYSKKLLEISKAFQIVSVVLLDYKNLLSHMLLGYLPTSLLQFGDLRL